MALFVRLLTRGHCHYSLVKLFFDSVQLTVSKKRHTFFAKALLFKRVPPICYKSGLGLVCRKKRTTSWYPVIVVNDIKKKP